MITLDNASTQHVLFALGGLANVVLWAWMAGYRSATFALTVKAPFGHAIRVTDAKTGEVLGRAEP